MQREQAPQRYRRPSNPDFNPTNGRQERTYLTRARRPRRSRGNGWVGRTARCPQFAGPFPYGPRRTGRARFPGIRLSGDLCRGCGWLRHGSGRGRRADDEGLAPHLRHERGPCGLAWSRFPEFCEAGDLVDCHRGAVSRIARTPARGAGRSVPCGGRRAGPGAGSVMTARRSCRRGIPPNRATRSGLPSRCRLASKQVRGPSRWSRSWPCSGPPSWRRWSRAWRPASSASTSRRASAAVLSRQTSWASR